ncbi:SHOCT domain-containing protein [Calderihabitans maritimus]|uniref:SHOCT domain-containing protein n=1 Tax=Calderihabitans maritimus TaxID=1246530 RepID=A0A1Z5HPD0_9FIRM|nr:SHOCT domain-containing protein [Calderihabitans maritimus]GAW91298.1 hypothetical protein KKC1_04600 [Calderihabitans maritimus]
MKKVVGLALVLIMVLTVGLIAAVAAEPDSVLAKPFRGAGAKYGGLQRLLENGTIDQEQYEKITAVIAEIADLREELKDLEPAERRAKMAEVKEAKLKELLESGVISEEQYDQLMALMDRGFPRRGFGALHGKRPADIGVKNIRLYQRLEELGNQEINDALKKLKETVDKRTEVLKEIKKEILPQLREVWKSRDTERNKQIIQKRIEELDVESKLAQAKIDVRKAGLKIELELSEEQIDEKAIIEELKFIIDKEEEITTLLEQKLKLYQETVELFQ